VLAAHGLLKSNGVRAYRARWMNWFSGSMMPGLGTFPRWLGA
jgi:hypothetical protein